MFASGDMGREEAELNDREGKPLTAKAKDEQAEANREALETLSDIGVDFVDPSGKDIEAGDINLLDIPKGVIPALEEVAGALTDPDTEKLRDGVGVQYTVGTTDVDITFSNGNTQTIGLLNDDGSARKGVGKAVNLADKTGMDLGYDSRDGWRLIYGDGEKKCICFDIAFN